MLKDLEEQYKDFESLTDAKEQELYKVIIDRANADRAAFQRYLNGLEYGILSFRTAIYHAISEYPKGFDDLILHEIETIIELTESGDEKATEELDSIFWLSAAEDMSTEFYQKLLHLFTQKSQSHNDDVKAEIVNSLFLVLNESKLDLDYLQLTAFQALLKDKNVKIRLKTHDTLEDFDLLPNGFKLSFMDRLKKKFFGYSYI